MRRNYLLTLFLPGILCAGCTQQEQQEKPNLLIINIDDLGWRDLGFMGTEYYETPHIDSLADAGMIFTNAYAPAANCAPSRACLMTGKWTPRHGVYTVGSSERGKSEDRKIIPVENITTLSPDHATLAEVLKKAGYVTCHAGKWHLSENPLDYGFDRNIGGGHNGHPSSYYPPYRNVNIREEGDKYLTDIIMEKAVGFVDTVKTPFFLYYAPYAVHTPIQEVDSLMNEYRNKPEWRGQDNPKYATMVDNLDRNIGLLINTLKKHDLYKNTLIILTSDNGGLYGITKQLPLRAGKGSYYEGGIRVPFAVVWKDKVKAGSKSHVPVSGIDIFPTILECVDINDDNNTDGVSILPVLLGSKDTIDRPLFWHFPIYLQAYNVDDNENRDPLFRTRPGSVIRYGKWKLHYYFEDKEIELYNLEDDISERNDLSSKRPDKVKELMQMLRDWWKETGADIPEELNPEYISGK